MTFCLDQCFPIFQSLAPFSDKQISIAPLPCLVHISTQFFTLKLFPVSLLSFGFSSGIRELVDSQIYGGFTCAKLYNIPPETLCWVLSGEVAVLTQDKELWWNFWFHKSQQTNAHCIIYYLFVGDFRHL